MQLIALLLVGLLPLSLSKSVTKFVLPCGEVYEQGDAGYNNATYIDNGRPRAWRLPKYIAMANCTADVQAALKFAHAQNLSFAVKGGYVLDVINAMPYGTI